MPAHACASPHAVPEGPSLGLGRRVPCPASHVCATIPRGLAGGVYAELGATWLSLASLKLAAHSFLWMVPVFSSRYCCRSSRGILTAWYCGTAGGA